MKKTERHFYNVKNVESLKRSTKKIGTIINYDIYEFHEDVENVY